jgi:hypothetical protein
MTTDTTFEQRLLALEDAVAEIRRQLAASPPATSNWIERFRGAFADEPAFAEVVAYGLAFRESDRPREEQKEP